MDNANAKHAIIRNRQGKVKGFSGRFLFTELEIELIQ